jgi:hypothetical protein
MFKNNECLDRNMKRHHHSSQIENAISSSHANSLTLPALEILVSVCTRLESGCDGDIRCGMIIQR